MVVKVPETRYARTSDGVHVAYQVVGEGPFDLVAVLGYVSHVELALHRDGPWIDAKSPVKIMRVKASKGSMLYFRARGADARDAIASLVALVDRRFDEDEHETGERAHG